jgi:hypothetical protein
LFSPSNIIIEFQLLTASLNKQNKQETTHRNILGTLINSRGSMIPLSNARGCWALPLLLKVVKLLMDLTLPLTCLIFLITDVDFDNNLCFVVGSQFLCAPRLLRMYSIHLANHKLFPTYSGCTLHG